jgi:hypothetical protein
MFWTFKLSFDVDTLAFLGLALFQNIGQFFLNLLVTLRETLKTIRLFVRNGTHCEFGKFLKTSGSFDSNKC